MSARVSRVVPPKGAGRNSQRRKMVLDVDLNVPLSDTFSEVGTSSHAPPAPQVQPVAPQVVPIDVESFDDDVVLCSPRAFAEAKNNSRRNRIRSNAVNIDQESSSRNAANHRNKRQRVPSNQPIINCESYVISERRSDGVIENGKSFPVQTSIVPPPPPPPPEPTFNCPVCMGPLVEEMTTKCGHIFCKPCIKKSISTQGKCPTCRRKVTMKDTIRIYLPSTS